MLIGDRNMDIFEELEVMQNMIPPKDWTEFESHYRNLCSKTANSNIAERIERVDFSEYSKELESSWKLSLSSSDKANAIYFEYDLDNNWDSSFFVCQEYTKREFGDDDWACEWLKDLQGPKFEELTEIYADTDNFCKTPEATAITLYLIARTVATFGRIVSRQDINNLAITIGFHGQDPIMRIIEE